jgi:four helix bundle protein
MPLETYRDLDVWGKAMDLVDAVYGLSLRFPDQERYGLRSQIQRAAVSIPANIAEGYGRLHRGDYVHHLSVSRGSLAELETHILLSVRLRYVPEVDALPVWEQCQDVGKMLRKLIQSLTKQ